MVNKVIYNPTGLEERCIYKGNWGILLTIPATGGGPSNETGIYAGADMYVPINGVVAKYHVYTPTKVFTTENDTDFLQYIIDLGGNGANTIEALEWAQLNDDVLVFSNNEYNTGLSVNSSQHDHIYMATGGLVLSMDINNENCIIDRKPTINLATATPQQGGWSGSYNHLGGKSFKFSITNFHVPTGSTGAGWTSWLWPVGEYVGETITISAKFKHSLETNGTFAWMMTGLTREDGHSYLGYSDASNKVQITTNKETEVYWTGTVTDAAQRIGFTIWCNNGRPGNAFETFVDDVQIELGERTPFVEDARTAATLVVGETKNKYSLELKNGVQLLKDPTYDLRYLSFDGTDDYGSFLSENNFNSGNGYNFTFEIMFKMRELPTAAYGSNGHIWGGENGNDLVLYLAPNEGEGSRGNMVFDDARYHENHYTNTRFQENVWYHWVVVGNGTNNTLTHYVNGVLDRENSSITASQINRPWGGTRLAYDARWNTYSKLDINLIRQYDKILSAEEVTKNYEILTKHRNITT